MGAMAYQITSLTIVYPTVHSGGDQRKHQSSVSLAFVRRIHRGPVNSPHKGPATRKMIPFHDVIILTQKSTNRDMCSCSWTAPTSDEILYSVNHIYFLFHGLNIQFLGILMEIYNKARSVMAELAPFSPPAWERATEHRTAPTSGGAYASYNMLCICLPIHWYTDMYAKWFLNIMYYG